MTRRFWILLVAFGALVAASFAGRTGAIVSLGLAAVIVALIMPRRRPRALSWRLAMLGTLAWGIEEAAWSVNRLYNEFNPTFITEVGYYLGAAAWLGALLLAPSKRLPRSLVLAAIPPVALILWMLVDEMGNAAGLVFPLVELVLLLAALPFLGGTVKSGASEGRLLVVMGFFFRALAAASYSWLSGGTNPDFLFLWLLSYVCLGVGIYMELNARLPTTANASVLVRSAGLELMNASMRAAESCSVTTVTPADTKSMCRSFSSM